MHDRNETTPEAASADVTIEEAYERAAKSLEKSIDLLTRHEKLRARNKALGLNVIPANVRLATWKRLKLREIAITAKRKKAAWIRTGTFKGIAWKP